MAMNFVWLIPIFLLISFILTFAFGKKLKEHSAYIAISLTSISFIMSLLVMFQTFSGETFKQEFTWLTYGETSLTLGVWVNPLNALMLVIVTFISLAVLIYSKAYMKGEANFHRYYAYMSLFTFAMLGLVLSPNLLQIYIFWELVGLGSFLIIGFYATKESARVAAKKAFIMTRIGDAALLLGIVYLFSKLGTLDLEQIFASVEYGVISEKTITIAAILIFIGAMGKSAQFPLHSWLPDAMEGPTPASALIHAATMVAAGVYLVAVMYPLFAASETALMVVAVVGGFTAIFAASIALVQKDIKKILAYSTISQLGFMMLALGSLGYVAGVFHLTTHAFFKALLFLAAGAVIHATHTQNIFEMGGLWKKMRFTSILFLIGTMAIAGVPLLSGFFSKEAIFASVWNAGHEVLFVVALIAAFMTALYMFRLFFVVFLGETSEKTEHAKDPSLFMLIPMAVLGFMAVFVGYISTGLFGDFLGEWLLGSNPFIHLEEHGGETWLMILVTLVSLAGIYLAYELYFNKRERLTSKLITEGWVYKTLFNGYYVDAIYSNVVVTFFDAIASITALIDFMLKLVVNKSASLSTNVTSKSLLKTHNGQIQRQLMVALVIMVVTVLLIAKQGGFL